ncbi:MAG TPA: universal stress protein, partial [Kofleriaceae bacterium]|nr:universal stress protein [Kofleriaceae bacterium]
MTMQATASAKSRVLVAVDLSDCSRASLDRAASLAAGMNAAVDLLHVWTQEVPPVTRRVEPAARLALARALLAMEDLRRAVLRDQVADSRLRIAYGSPAEAIIQVAREGYHLIIMGGHRHAETGPRHGVIDRVTAGAPCPVLTVDGAG